jgi:AsmA family protein
LLKAAAVVVLLIVLSGTAVVLAWNAGLLRSSFVHFVSWHYGRPIDVHGALHLHLLTATPWIEAEQVSIGNPPWTEAGITAEIAKLTVVFAPLLSHQTGLRLLKIDKAQLHFTRDSAGRANWQRADPNISPGGPLPMISALELARSHVSLKDERLHLVYDGDLSIAGLDPAQALRMEGSGMLNQHAVSLLLKSDPLQSAAPGKPYTFEFDERSSGVHFTAHGLLPQPFDLSLVDADFEASGADLRDLYYLVGVSLPNTAAFHLRGRMARRGNKTLLEGLKVVSGQSDVQGHVSLETQKNGRTLLRADLNSAVMRLADIGLRAAGRDPHPEAPPKLFSDVQLITPATQRVDAVGKYTARRLVLSRVEVSTLTAPFTLEHGLIEAPEVTGYFMGGNFLLRLHVDANKSPARSRIDMMAADLHLSQMPHKSEPPPYEGALHVQIHAEGPGNSLHALAAGADGTLRAWVLQGTIRASLAELTGVDFRGLGLTLTGSRREVPVSCAAADFEAHEGVMHLTRFFIDSEQVFISGEGRVLLDPETLDLKLHGEPKGLRILRLKAPVLVQGALLQPKFSVDVADSGLRLVDRGTARDADCATLPDANASKPGIYEPDRYTAPVK